MGRKRKPFEEAIKEFDRRVQTLAAIAYKEYIGGADDVGDALTRFINSRDGVKYRYKFVWNSGKRAFDLGRIRNPSNSIRK